LIFEVNLQVQISGLNLTAKHHPSLHLLIPP
jgi:hypothetical protein